MPFFPFIPDRVAVFGDGFLQLFPYARPVRAQVLERSQMMDHPIETGQIITDYSIVLPIEINLSMIVESQYYRDTYQQIRNNYLNKNTLTVQTNSANYTNMVIAEMPHEERPEMFDALAIVLRLRQVQLVPDPNTYAPADAASSDTTVLGQQNGYTVTGSPVDGGLDFSSVPPEAVISTILSVSLPQIQGVTISALQTVTSQQAIKSVL